MAGRQWDAVRRGYMSEDAEVCYWRSLIRRWSSVARLGDGKLAQDEGRGLRWETFAFMG
jgi:hypothetical protein